MPSPKCRQKVLVSQSAISTVLIQVFQSTVAIKKKNPTNIDGSVAQEFNEEKKLKGRWWWGVLTFKP